MLGLSFPEPYGDLPPAPVAFAAVSPAPDRNESCAPAAIGFTSGVAVALVAVAVFNAAVARVRIRRRCRASRT